MEAILARETQRRQELLEQRRRVIDEVEKRKAAITEEKRALQEDLERLRAELDAIMDAKISKMPNAAQMSLAEKQELKKRMKEETTQELEEQTKTITRLFESAQLLRQRGGPYTEEEKRILHDAGSVLEGETPRAPESGKRTEDKRN